MSKTQGPDQQPNSLRGCAAATPATQEQYLHRQAEMEGV